jgi:uncharacterized protein (TIGR03435 family)
MMLRIVVCAVLLLAVSFAQSPTAQSERPRFGVVSIKPIPRPTPGAAQFDSPRDAFKVDGARVQIRSDRLLDLVTRAFRVPLSQVEAPDFARDVFFEIQATLPAEATPEQVPEMLQAMLAERFKLVYHRESREYQMDVLTVGKSGIKLPRLPDDTPIVFGRKLLPDGTTRRIQIGKVTSLFVTMNSFGGLHLVDETGLGGIYTWVQDEPPPTPGLSPQVAEQEGLQESFKAMIEAAGLKLETRKVPKETIVVDHLEKTPTDN